MDKFAAQRTRLATVEGDLVGLQAQHDLAMSAFKFDEANALQRRIEALEDARRSLAAALPPLSAAPEPAACVVPILARPRGRLRPRPRR